MGTPSKEPLSGIDSLLDELDEYKVAAKPVQERPMPEYIARQLHQASQKRVSAAEELPPPPQWPMLTGVLLFPFYLKTLEVFMFSSFGFMVSGWLLMFWIQYGFIGGTATVYYIGVGVCAAIGLTLGYLITCCLTIIESTALGWDSIEISAGIDWKEWFWNLAHIFTLLLQAGMVGYAAQLICARESWLPMFTVTYAVFPLVLLGALAAEGAWYPQAIVSVLRSLIQVGWAWALFYFEMTPMIVVWYIITIKLLAGRSPWLTPLFAGPLFAFLILIYARLIGRLAGCISASTKKSFSQGDDDEY
jgi:hypothetical protein